MPAIAVKPVTPSLSRSPRPSASATFRKQPFADLLVAFRQDQTVTRFETMDDVLDYCHYSANPVGHLVLYVCGYRDAERFALSDHTCSALQLANFWQDVRVDYTKGPHLFSRRKTCAVSASTKPRSPTAASRRSSAN